MTDEAYAVRVAKELAYLNVFSDVRLGEADAKAGEWAVLPQLPKGDCSSSNLLALLTLGVVPSVHCAAFGRRFAISGAGLLRPLDVDSTREITVVVGWFAGVLKLFPGWASEFPRDAELMALRLAVEEKVAPFCGRAGLQTKRDDFGPALSAGWVVAR